MSEPRFSRNGRSSCASTLSMSSAGSTFQAASISGGPRSATSSPFCSPGWSAPAGATGRTRERRPRSVHSSGWRRLRARPRSPSTRAPFSKRSSRATLQSGLVIACARPFSFKRSAAQRAPAIPETSPPRRVPHAGRGSLSSSSVLHTTMSRSRLSCRPRSRGLGRDRRARHRRSCRRGMAGDARRRPARRALQAASGAQLGTLRTHARLLILRRRQRTLRDASRGFGLACVKHWRPARKGDA